MRAVSLKKRRRAACLKIRCIHTRTLCWRLPPTRTLPMRIHTNPFRPVSRPALPTPQKAAVFTRAVLKRLQACAIKRIRRSLSLSPIIGLPVGCISHDEKPAPPPRIGLDSVIPRRCPAFDDGHPGAGAVLPLGLYFVGFIYFRSGIGNAWVYAMVTRLKKEMIMKKRPWEVRLPTVEIHVSSLSFLDTDDTG